MDKYGLTDSQIRQHTGRTSFTRGQTYRKGGRVTSLAFDNENTVTATVRGSQRYAVKVTFRTVSGKRSIGSSTCSCPVGGSCKHVAAVLLEARAKLAENVQEAAIVSEPSLWQRTLDVLANDTAGKTEAGIVGVLFELQHTVTTRGSYYGPPKITKPAGNGKIKLGLRPVVPGMNGRWINNGLTWSHVAERWNRLNLRASHQRWFKELWALYCTANDEARYYGSADKWLYLDDFASGNVWSLLRQGSALGVPFIQADRNQTHLEMADTPLTPVVSVISKDGGLRVAPELQFERRTVSLEYVRFFGDPAVGVYLWQDGTGTSSLKEAPLLVAPLSTAIDASFQEQITKKTVTRIPPAEVEDFKQRYYPRLAQRLTIVTDGKTELPGLGQPQLVVRVRADSAMSLSIALIWRYSINDQPYELPLRPDPSRTEKIIRAEHEERRILSAFIRMVSEQQAFFAAISDELLENVTLTDMAAVSFVTIQLPQLQMLQDDILVEIEGVLPVYEEYADEPLVQVGTKAGDEGTDWFDLHVSLKIGDHEVPMEQLLIALGSGEPYLLLDNGVFFRLDHPKLLQLRHMVEEARSLQDTESGSLRLSKFQAGLWEELASLGIVTEQAAAWQHSVQGLLDITRIPKIETPTDLNATLRPYQSDGFSWLAFLYEHRLGGILADDMGLGKTLQTLALLLHIKNNVPDADRQPHLVVAPTSVAANWAAEIARFAPGLTVSYLQETTAKANLSLDEQIRKADIVITTYALCRLDEEQYLAQVWGLVVLDEAQFVKNHQSKGYQVVRKLTARLKVALTGTPIENNLMELWALLSITAPGLFPNPKHFSDSYRKPIERQGDKELLRQLRQRIRPLMLRRTKDQVVKELPARVEQVLELELNEGHQEVYDLYLQRERQRVLGMLGDFDKNRFAILKAITTLRQLSLDPKLVDPKKYKHISSTKLDGLLEQLDEVVREGHRALVFSQFTSFLATVRKALDKQKTPYLYLDGATKKRSALLKTFKASATPLFLISLKAGGFGLNLTEADYCFLLDPWWNPAVEQQAVDRAHRIGQTKTVMVYRLISKGTIEEKVMALKARKAKLFNSVLDEGELFSSAITAADIKGLFDA